MIFFFSEQIVRTNSSAVVIPEIKINDNAENGNKTTLSRGTSGVNSSSESSLTTNSDDNSTQVINCTSEFALMCVKFVFNC